jgi:hypothetical protein
VERAFIHDSPTQYLSHVELDGTTAIRRSTQSKMIFGDLEFNQDPSNPDLLQLQNDIQDSIWKNLADSSVSSEAVNDSFDESSLDTACKNAQGSQLAFPPVDWGHSFAANAAKSWHFASNNPTPGGTINLNVSNSSGLPGGNSVFMVRSIADNCIVESSARVVSGFFGCKQFTINDRAQPLQVIGTVITQKLDIHPNALKSGINWSSIYYPNSTRILRQLQILSPAKPPAVSIQLTGAAGPSFLVANNVVVAAPIGNTCDDLAPANSPLWHPYPSLVESAKSLRCNPSALRAYADPFTWTQVDPDCGLISGAAGTQCKKQRKMFIQKEINREDQIR